MVYLKTISKNIWAGYLPPESDELFSSWFFRVARNHYVKSHTFGKIYFTKYSFWNRDVDISTDEGLRKIVVLNTPLQSDRVEQMFLSSYETRMFEKINSKGNTMGLLPLGINHRLRNNFGLLYCSKCLAKNIPYYKKNWRLLTSLLCVECKNMLRDRCPRCNSPIAFHRLEQGKKNDLTTLPFFSCAFCSYDLRLSPSDRFDNGIVEYQNVIDKYLSSGYANNLAYSFLYFDAFYILCALLSREHNKFGRFRKACINEFGEIPIIKGKKINRWRIEDRVSVLITVFKLLENRSLFSNMFEKGNLRVCEFGYIKKAPFWLNYIKT